MTGVPADTDETVLVERDAKATAVVTLNRPDRSNALNIDLKNALLAALREVAEDTGIRAVVLTGAGRAFCVGQDLAEHAEILEREAASALNTVEEHYNPIVQLINGMPKPVVAAVNGSCVGAGLGFALACDLRVAAEGMKFATAFAGVGLSADSGLSATLTHSLGTARASELLLLNEPFTAERAQAWGLVRSVVAPEAVRDVAVELAHQLAAGPTAAYAEIKQAVRIGATASLDEALAAEAAAQARLATTHDHAAAVRAFLAKQPPSFEGR
jgi:2-(1,2-epoxy-1,2-dihydrophenyl)acetyl-CoA isomerase